MFSVTKWKKISAYMSVSTSTISQVELAYCISANSNVVRLKCKLMYLLFILTYANLNKSPQKNHRPSSLIENLSRKKLSETRSPSTDDIKFQLNKSERNKDRINDMAKKTMGGPLNLEKPERWLQKV